MTRIVVVGAKSWRDQWRVSSTLGDYLLEVGERWAPERVTVATGGTPGAEEFAEAWAQSERFTVETVHPNFKDHHEHPIARRDQALIASLPDVVFIFAKPSSGRARRVSGWARAVGIPVRHVVPAQ
jgi:hypothetical protein